MNNLSMEFSGRNTLERHNLWVEIYERELAKPQWECIDPIYQHERTERYAMLTADIALLYSKVGLNEPNL